MVSDLSPSLVTRAYELRGLSRHTLALCRTLHFPERGRARSPAAGQQLQQPGEQLPAKDPLQDKDTTGGSEAAVAADVGQLVDRVQTDESGSSEDTSAYQDVLEEISQTKEAQSRMQGEIRMIQEALGLGNLQDAAGRLPRLGNLRTLASDVQMLKERLGLYPNPEEVNNMVHWDVLEDCLVGGKGERGRDGGRPRREQEGDRSATTKSPTPDVDTPHGASSVLAFRESSVGLKDPRTAVRVPKQQAGIPSDQRRDASTRAMTQTASQDVQTTSPGTQQTHPESMGTQTTRPGTQATELVSTGTQTISLETQPTELVSTDMQTISLETQPTELVSTDMQTISLETQPTELVSTDMQTISLGTQPTELVSTGTQTISLETQPTELVSTDMQTISLGTQPTELESMGTQTIRPGTQPTELVSTDRQTTSLGTQPTQLESMGTQTTSLGTQPTEPETTGTETTSLGTQPECTVPQTTISGEQLSTELHRAGPLAAGTLLLTAQGFEIPLDADPSATSHVQELALPSGSSSAYHNAYKCYVETVEALKQIGQLRHLYAALKEQVAQLEATRLERTELEKLRLLLQEGGQESIANMLGDLQAQVSPLQGVARDLQEEKGKIRKLESALGKLEAARASWQTDLDEQLSLPLGSTPQQVKRDMKDLAEHQQISKAALDQLVTQMAEEGQEQLKEVRVMENTGQEEAGCPTCSSDTSMRLGKLLRCYEKLQGLVDSLMSTKETSAA
ncbi:uncharacterized protein LOC133207229 [Neopsephotus bourkii]|uniref:uncharacterized protein LOC133207229 n=1 Tax=Neopsephotus bourkii TaxID=309878 RepID=UPI002AA54B5D|nr:uncharacterized protein LOC133207229 [Neopsephotus bourkii]